MESSTVVSADGTEISFRRIGAGPPLLVLHGAMQSALSQRALATALAGRFPVVLPDRRGRGASGPFGPAPAPAARSGSAPGRSSCSTRR